MRRSHTTNRVRGPLAHVAHVLYLLDGKDHNGTSHMRRALVTCLLVAVTSAGTATDATAQTCRESVYRSFADAQRTWQISLKDLIVSSRPDYEELVSLSADLQLAMIERSQARFVYLMTQQSDRMCSTGDLSQLVNVGLQWTPADEQALLARCTYCTCSMERTIMEPVT